MWPVGRPWSTTVLDYYRKSFVTVQRLTCYFVGPPGEYIPVSAVACLSPPSCGRVLEVVQFADMDSQSYPYLVPSHRYSPGIQRRE